MYILDKKKDFIIGTFCHLSLFSVLFVICPCSLTESPFKVHLEKLSLRQKKLDKDLQLYQTSLELKLKHSTVHVDELCPLIVPNPGVAVIHDYADWIKEASADLLEPQSEYGLCC